MDEIAVGEVKNIPTGAPSNDGKQWRYLGNGKCMRLPDDYDYRKEMNNPEYARYIQEMIETALSGCIHSVDTHRNMNNKNKQGSDKCKTTPKPSRT